MQALCLMPSHSYFYKKLDEFGLDYDKEILINVENEGKRKEAQAAKFSLNPHGSCESPATNTTPILHDTLKPQESPIVTITTDTMHNTLMPHENPTTSTTPITLDALTVHGSHTTTDTTATPITCDTITPQKDPAANCTAILTPSTGNPTTIRKSNILESLAQIQSEDFQPPEKHLVVFSHWKMNLDDQQAIHCEPSSANICEKVTKPSKNYGNATLHLNDTGRKFVLDNVDVHQITHDMTEKHQNPDAHYCSLMCTENRVSGNHLSDVKPICDLKDLENGKCCPSKSEHCQQRENYIHLVSRVITDELPCLTFLKDVVVYHIPHMYSKEMRQKTDTVSIFTYICDQFT